MATEPLVPRTPAEPVPEWTDPDRMRPEPRRVLRRLRVLTLVDRLMTSGAEVLATQLAMSLAQERFESFICSTRRSDEAYVAMVEAAGVRALVLGRRSRLDLWRWHPLVELLRRERVDVIHAHKFGSNAWAVPVARLGRVPVLVAHEHSRSYDGQALRRFIDRELIGRSADIFLSTSREDRDRMVEVERVDPVKARYLPNGVPAPRVGDGSRIREELGLSATDPVVGTVCGLRVEKALEVFLDATSILVQSTPSLKVVIVGDGPERRRLEEHARTLGLGKTVNFVGAQPHERVVDFLAVFDVAVSSSDFEGGPLAVLEFMAAGKAVVATTVGGLPELIEHGVHGLLVPPRDPSRMAEAIRQLLVDEQLRMQLGVRARERQRERFDLGVMVERLQALYESLYWLSPRGLRESAEAARNGSRAWRS